MYHHNRTRRRLIAPEVEYSQLQRGCTSGTLAHSVSQWRYSACPSRPLIYILLLDPWPNAVPSSPKDFFGCNLFFRIKFLLFFYPYPRSFPRGWSRGTSDAQWRTTLPDEAMPTNSYYLILICAAAWCTAQRLTFQQLLPNRINGRTVRMVGDRDRGTIVPPRIIHWPSAYTYYNYTLSQTPAVSEDIVMTPGPTGIRRQPTFPGSMPFPCKNMTSPGLGRSTVRPTSVHKLRPGDIDVVGAMGDSLVAGNGALEEYAMGTLIEYRGVSWAAGIESRAWNILPLCKSNRVRPLKKIYLKTLWMT